MIHSKPPPERPGGRKEPSRSGGFTLVEVLTVLVILGILSLAIVSRTGSLDGQQLARMSEVRAQLRYVQLRAMKTGSVHGIRCDATDYWAFSGSNSTNPAARLPLPGESSALVSLAGKAMTMTAFTYFFDGFGIPYTGTATTKLAAPATIAITAGGNSGILTVTPETGYVP